MSSKNSAFACFADAAESSPEPIVLKTDKQLTINDLIEFLNNAIRNDPSVKELPIFNVEFGELTKTFNVELDISKERLVIASSE